MRCYFSLLLLSVLLAFVPAAHASEKRAALIIGNAAYAHTVPLKNARNDAKGMSQLLSSLGFQVIEGLDLDKRAMERAIRDFRESIVDADLALFFYAGHGIQVAGQNYLLPTDAQLANESDVDFETVPLHLVLKQMEREAKASIVLLDACRDNPLTRRLSRSMGTRSAQIAPGLAEVKTGVGTLIGFATQPGNFAYDGKGANSPYTEALLKHLATPGEDITTILSVVRGEVVKRTSGLQVPWEHTSLVGQVFFKPALPKPADAPSESAVRQYDGIWLVRRSIEPGCGARGHVFTISIKNGVVRTPGRTEGTVSEAGVLRIPGRVNVFTGQIEGDAGQGTYQGLCSGTFTVTRQSPAPGSAN